MYKEAIIVSGGEKGNLRTLLLPLEQSEEQERIFIGVDAGALALLSEGFPIDVAIGDFDSISPAKLHLLKEKAGIVYELPPEKDVTDTEAALTYVEKHLSVERIKMLGLLGGRIDHLISNLWIAYHPDYQDLLEKIIILDQQNTLRFYRPGHYQIQKERDKKYLSFIGMSPLKKLTLRKVKYSLERKDFPSPIALVSNEFLEKEMNFSFAEGLLAVVQSKDK